MNKSMIQLKRLLSVTMCSLVIFNHRFQNKHATLAAVANGCSFEKSCYLFETTKSSLDHGLDGTVRPST